MIESAYRYPTVELGGFHPCSFGTAEEHRLNTLYPVKALCLQVRQQVCVLGPAPLEVVPLNCGGYGPSLQARGSALKAAMGRHVC